MSRLTLPTLPNFRCKSPRDIIEEAVVKRKGVCSSNIRLKRRKSGRLNCAVTPLATPIPEDEQSTIRRRKTGLQIAVPASAEFLEVMCSMIKQRFTCRV